MPAKINLANQRFGKLLVIKEVEKEKRIDNRPTWECQCDCGEKCLATSKQLRSGNKINCGCFTRGTKDITGIRFGKLTALRPTKERSHNSVVWECQCDCGNITYARAEGLRVGDNTSCGCNRGGKEQAILKTKENLIGKKFGKLIVLDISENRNSANRILWKCQCDCGNIIEVSTNHLTTGNTQSCGCLQGYSIGELQIKEILLSNGIKFKQEYIFSEFPNRRYDFAILDDDNIVKYLIEFDGEQHYIEAPFFKKSLKEQQSIDKEKTEFARLKNIPLIRIPYWKRKNLTLNDLEMK